MPSSKNSAVLRGTFIDPVKSEPDDLTANSLREVVLFKSILAGAGLISGALCLAGPAAAEVAIHGLTMVVSADCSNHTARCDGYEVIDLNDVPDEPSTGANKYVLFFLTPVGKDGIKCETRFSLSDYRGLAIFQFPWAKPPFYQTAYFQSLGPQEFYMDRDNFDHVDSLPTDHKSLFPKRVMVLAERRNPECIANHTPWSVSISKIIVDGSVLGTYVPKQVPPYRFRATP